jgi:metal-dependent amidase/aminoacylase/carboxypeptidase family protein
LRGKKKAFEGAPPTPLIAIRADIDAISMTEENPDLPYHSRTEKVAHQCGHDAHLSILLGAAALFQQNIEDIPETSVVRLLF